MNNSIYRISLDIHDTSSQVSLRVKRGDTARSIYITLTENGKPYKIAEGCSANFEAKKADGNFIHNACRIEGNTIIYDLTAQTTAAVGATECEIALFDEQGEKLTSPCFIMVVEDTVYNGEEIVSTPEADALKVITDEARVLIADVEEKLANGDFKGEKGDKGEPGETPDLSGYATKEELEEALENIPTGEGGTITVDQTYNPDSENPQSGVAVKEAVAAEQKRIDNISANAIKGTVSGSEILLTDVSPIVHDMKVRVSSDSISDLSTVKLIKSNGSGETIAEYTPTADGTVDSVTSRGAKQKNKSDIWDGSVSTGLQGTGSKDDPFLINSAADFAYFATSSHAKQYTKLMSDIYLNDVSDPEWYKGENLNTWTPGEAPGNFDGNGYVVHGIYINEPDNAKGAGLFGNIANEASQTISNLGIEDSYISVSTSSGYAAALFCMANWGAGPVVKNCYVSDTVILKGYSVGGLAGFLGITTTFINCYASAQITANHLDGALVAFGSYSDVYNQCYSSQNLSFVRYGGDNSTFTNCYAVDNTYCYKVTQLTTEQMTGEAAYDNMAGLDFRAVWYVNEYGLPRLRAFLYDAIELTTDTEGVKIYCEYNRNANKCLENISNKIASLRNYADSTFATITAFNTLKSIVARKKVTYRDVAQNEKLIIEKSKVYIFKAYSSDNAAINLWVTDSSGTEAQAYDDSDELFPNCTAGILICPADTYNYSGVLLVGITGKLSFMNNPFYGKVLANWKHSSIKNLFLKLTAGDDMGVWTIAL